MPPSCRQRIIPRILLPPSESSRQCTLVVFGAYADERALVSDFVDITIMRSDRERQVVQCAFVMSAMPQRRGCQAFHTTRFSRVRFQPSFTRSFWKITPVFHCSTFDAWPQQTSTAPRLQAAMGNHQVGHSCGSGVAINSQSC